MISDLHVIKLVLDRIIRTRSLISSFITSLRTLATICVRTNAAIVIHNRCGREGNIAIIGRGLCADDGTGG